jgi:hypothetical protein
LLRQSRHLRIALKLFLRLGSQGVNCWRYLREKAGRSDFMRRQWPDDLDFILDGAQEVTLEEPANGGGEMAKDRPASRQALRVRLTQQDFERIWPLAEARYRLGGARTGKAITLVTTNPHYHRWHPTDGGVEEHVSESGRSVTTNYVVVHFLLDDVRETVEA